SQKPPSPPPAYAELDHPGQSTSSSQPHITSQPPAHRHPDGYYGPTPLMAQPQTHILPYYDPRSQHSVAESTTRARWRFIGALLWALLILSVVSTVCGMEADIQRRPWRGWRV
ncbi:hypothetical protein BC835DRAFT_1235351, partial [Cytidiella melzeri]